MKLNLSEIKEITLGAVRILENENGIDFYRFTEEQENFYEKRSEDFYKKTFSTSGIRLRFRTDSRNLFLKAEITSGTGIPEDMIKKAISLGVSEINVNTECQLSVAAATRKYVEAGMDLEGKGFDPRKLLAPG